MIHLACFTMKSGVAKLDPKFVFTFSVIRRRFWNILYIFESFPEKKYVKYKKANKGKVKYDKLKGFKFR